VITLFVRTKTRPEPTQAAPGSSLPTVLAGFSVLLKQTFSAAPLGVPILSVRPVDVCSGIAPAACTTHTAISVEIPFELTPNAPGSRLPENFATLTVVENGDSGEAMPLNPVSDQIHILNSCDLPVNPQSSPCRPAVMHADGSPVTADKPAQAGETITLYAYGLGLGASRIASGAISPAPAIGVNGVVVDFRYGTNLAVVQPGANAGPAVADLLPGSIGVYRVQFEAPAAPSGTPACSAISSNSTLVVGRAASFDGVGLCLYVAPPNGGQQQVPPRGRR
jgi:uncharacterized protein (TIGR03437 family)